MIFGVHYGSECLKVTLQRLDAAGIMLCEADFAGSDIKGCAFLCTCLGEQQ